MQAYGKKKKLVLLQCTLENMMNSIIQKIISKPVFKK